MAEAALTPRSAFFGLTHAVGTGSGVIATDRDGLGLATVAVGRSHDTAVAHRVKERFGLQLPHGPHRAAAGDIAFAGTGPGVWLASRELGGNAFAAILRQEIGDLAAVTDQSDGYAVLRLAGPKLRNALAKLVPLDVHPATFKPGDVASTVASHMGVTLWRLDDAADGAPVFELAVFRSLAGSFWHALSTSAAEFGLSVAEAG
ncbi:MAG: sarcosine oxidase subunit gamma family protein [Steroidobacteraceae bacterium]